MNKFDRALQEMCSLEREASGDGWLQSMNPLIKLWLTVWYAGVVISLPNESLSQIFSMVLYPFGVFLAAELSLKTCFKRLRWFAGGVVLLGAANLFWAESLTGGISAMAGLCGKGVLTVTGVYLLAVTTRIEDICEGLRRIYVPEILVTVILLIYRYISVLLKETKKLSEAYQMRAPAQNGIRVRTWGAFVGQLLLRSMDRAHRVYDSMCVRGYEEGMTGGKGGKSYPIDAGAAAWLLFWTAGIMGLRAVPLFDVIGALVVK